MSGAIQILLVEDSPTDILLAEEALSTNCFQIQNSERLGDAMRLLRAQHFDVILLDLGLPDSQGLETLRTLRDKNPQVAVVVLTGKDDEELALQSLKEGAQDYLVKGQIQPNSLQRAIHYAVERSGFEKLLRQSEERVQELTAHIQQVLWMVDAQESKVLYVSAGYEKLWGRTCQSLYDDPRSYLDGIHPLDQERMARENAGMYQSGFIDAEFRVLRPDGSERWVWTRGYPIKEQGQLVRLVGVIEDITEKRRLAAERDVLLSRLELYFERLPLGYVLFDSQLCISDWNPAAERIFGFTKEEMLGLGPPYEKLVPPAYGDYTQEILSRVRSGDMNAHSVNENLTKDGRTITCQWFNTPLFESNGDFVGFLSLAQDITEQKSLQAQFHQAQKMEAIGQLAGGVAHDFNNLLTVIIGYADIIQDSLPAEGALHKMLQEVTRAADRAASLTRQLLIFSRRQVVAPKVVSLNEIVSEMEKMLRRLIGEDVELLTVKDAQLGRAEIDPGQLEQVVMNLSVNARDAMPQGGKLTIRTTNVEFDGMYSPSHSDIPTGPYVMLAVSDTGSGMSEATKARIFEPFFTTKEPGKGTGLGLATVHGIVRQAGGFIAVDSEVGRGTTFRIYFPRVADGLSQAIEQRAAAAPLASGKETILLVEDEFGIRMLMRHVLASRGHTILEACDGEEAVRMLVDHTGRIDLLVTDVVMPEMSGREVAEQAVGLRPGIKVIFISGYTDDAVTRHGVPAGANFLPKPFTPAAFMKKVREVFDDSSI